MKSSNKKAGGFGFGCFMFVLVFNILAGGWSVDQVLGWFDKNIPFWGDSLIGLFAAEFTFPAAIIGLILQAFGVF